MNGLYIQPDKLLTHVTKFLKLINSISIVPYCLTGFMPQVWTTGGMYTIIYTTDCLPPAQMWSFSTPDWSQSNPGPHLGTMILCVPSAVKPLLWAGANSWWAETPPKLWAHISQQSLCTYSLKISWQLLHQAAQHLFWHKSASKAPLFK